MECLTVDEAQLPGIMVEQVGVENAHLVILGRCAAATASCPACHQPSDHVHSYRSRTLHDLPSLGLPVILRLRIRRFRCTQPGCPRRTFTESLAPLAQRWAHRTDRLRAGLHRIAMMLAGEAGARLAKQIGMPSGGTTLLRLLRKRPPEQPASDKLGIDDWAWRRGQRYGTLIIDLVSHRPVDVLIDRTAETVTTWLQAHPGVTLIARDRASDYARAASAGAPAAVQVADRWHLLCNLRIALERLCQRLFAELQQLPISPDLRANVGWWARFRSGQRASAEEARKQAVYDRRRQRFEAVQRLKQAGWSIKQIARHLNVSWATARDDFERREFPPMPPPRLRRSGLDPHTLYLQTRWEAGCHNANQLWREIREKGYAGSQRMVMLWAQARREPGERHAGRPRFQPPLPSDARQTLDLPAASQMAWLLVCAPEKVEADQQPLLAHILQHSVVAAAYKLAQHFTRLVRERVADELPAWLTLCHTSAIAELRQFASGLQKDHAAVLAGLTLPWSSGPVEGNVTRLKLLKRQMYGRGAPWYGTLN